MDAPKHLISLINMETHPHAGALHTCDQTRATVHNAIHLREGNAVQ